MGASLQDDTKASPSRSEAAVLVGMFLLGVGLVFHSSPDDALITLRYASNVVRGWGPVFNRGERVEGYSSPLHLLVDIGIVALPGGAALFKAKLASIVFAVLALREATALASVFSFSRRQRLAYFAVVAGCLIMSTGAVNGLETSLECWLVTALVVRLTRGQHLTRATVAAVLGAGLVLCRPEAPLLFAGLALASSLDTRSSSWAARMRWTIAPACTLAALELWRHLYYDAWLPNTYYAKQAPKTWALMQTGISYLIHAVMPGADKLANGTLTDNGKTGIIELGLVVLLLVFGVVGCWQIFRHSRRLAYAVVVVVPQLLFTVVVGGDWMRGGRFLTAIFPTMAAVVLLGGTSLFRRAHLRKPVRSVALVGLCLISALYFVIPYQDEHAPIWHTGGDFSDQAIVEHSHYSQAAALVAGADALSCVPPGSLVAYTEMGYAPYVRQDLRFLDMAGLISRSVARGAPASIHGLSGVRDVNWWKGDSAEGRLLVKAHPDYILNSIDPAHPSVLDGRFQQLRRREVGGYTITLYGSPRSPCAQPSS